MNEPVEILLVEDYPIDQQIALRFFKKSQVPHQVQVVRDGFNALNFVFCRGIYQERSFERPPGVVFLDIRLPDMDGWQVLAQMKADSRTRNIPVLMMSAAVSPEETEKSRQLGAAGCIQKPLQSKKLTTMLENIRFDRKAVAEATARS
ncbi:MAG: response regulator with CheY-like receiver domain and winged-helix DNA-binding domain [Pedosphaera sp.]|nr:response regulator with CheY-like receiver domain and winged-helix DNA-binding domain [Pedosphaera sp.]